MGVRQDFQLYGLGILIKQFQKEKLMEILGIYTVTNTFDPLTGINAYRNIHHFGMDVVEYRDAFYEDFFGLLNRVDIPCDRFLIFWERNLITPNEEQNTEGRDTRQQVPARRKGNLLPVSRNQEQRQAQYC